MNILLTNDDGYTSFLLKDMYAFLPKILPKSSIAVMVPDSNCSGISAALSFEGVRRLTEIKDNFYILEGFPVDCVKLALHLKSHFDLVISGPNIGANLGNDIIYSGTASAACESAKVGIPSLALSIVDDSTDVKNIDIEQWHSFLSLWLLSLIDIAKANPESYININVPIPVPMRLQEAPLSKRVYTDSFHLQLTSSESKKNQKEYLVHRDFSLDSSTILEQSDWDYTRKGYCVMSVIPAFPRSIKSKMEIDDKNNR